MNLKKGQLEELAAIEKRYGSQVFLNSLAMRLENRGETLLDAEIKTEEDQDKAQACAKELRCISRKDVLAYLLDRRYCIAREGLLVSIRTQVGENEVLHAYVPSNVDIDVLKMALGSIDEKIEEYGREHGEDFQDLDVPDLVRITLEEFGISYMEPFPDLVFYI